MSVAHTGLPGTVTGRECDRGNSVLTALRDVTPQLGQPNVGCGADASAGWTALVP